MSPIIFGVVLLAALGLVFYVLLGRGAADLLVEQMQHREQAIVRSGAAAMAAFFDLAGRSMSMAAGGKLDNNNLQILVDRWQGTPLVGVIVTDEKGIVVGGANQARAPVNLVSVADRDYFQWAQTAQTGSAQVFEVVLSRTGQSQGQYVVTVASPVIDEQGKFKGVLTAAVLLSKLTELYLQPLKISNQTGVHLIQNDGTVLYSSVGLKTGENILDYVHKHPFLGSDVLVKKAEDGLKKGEEGKLNVVWPGGEGWQRYLAAYSPIKLEEGRWWYLVMTTPVDDALAFMGPIYVRIVGVFAVVFLGLLIYAIRLAKYFAFKEARKYEHLTHGIKE